MSMDYILRYDPSLKIMIYSNEETTRKHIFTITGSESYYWNNTIIEIPKAPLFSILIEAVIGEEDRGILAIDNIMIDSSICTGGGDSDDGSGSVVFIVVGVVLGIVAVFTVVLSFWFYKRRQQSYASNATTGITSVGYKETTNDVAVLVASEMNVDNPLYNQQGNGASTNSSKA
ncbi:uncharacterized protein [Antedon mediterranea]|uniref:uncharacterized protein n=1 Tax=Antedon mediterranea TaxID=105859 RepID=UPI003AF72E3C